MNIFQVIITAVLTTLAVLVLGVVAVWSLWPSSVEASAAIATHSGTWHSSADANENPGNHCAHLGGGHIKFGEAVLTAALDLDDTQQEALAPVAQTLEAWRAQAQATCEQTEFGNLDASLAGMEKVLSQSALAMAELRPAINNFYATLSDEQQTKMSDFIHSHHRKGRHGSFRGAFHGGAHGSH